MRNDINEIFDYYRIRKPNLHKRQSNYAQAIKRKAKNIPKVNPIV